MIPESVFAHPELECDVVMKGGVTSGIVYPRALCELAKRYRFKSLGGTSAGAIAAGMAAAAEHGRESGGFEALWRLPDWLSRDDHLFRLFQPDRATRPLFELFVAAAMGRGGRPQRLFRTAWLTARHFPLASIGGALFGLAVAYVGASQPALAPAVSVLLVVGGLLLALGGGAATAGYAVARYAHRALAAHNFGLCSGLGRDGDVPALSEWIADTLDALAGKTDPNEPLTFGDLAERDIELVTLTTNVTHGAPYRLPFDTRVFYFDPDELRELLPERIVAFMEREDNQPSPRDASHRERLAARLPKRPLPEIDKLPVALAIRMSLSFPLLLRAVPLWAVANFADEDKPLERTWFSDGGICSNFPMHFFDAPIPTRPTFGINLRPTETLKAEPHDNVAMGSAARGILPRWSSFDGPLGFLGAVVDTMMSWSDNLLLKYPGYRDRVAHVEHAPHEGGLNLDMPPDVVEGMVARGRAAGERLRRDFDWPTHKWTRYRSTMRVLERFMGQLRRGYETRDAQDTRLSYPALIARDRNEPRTSYMSDWHGPLRAFAERTTVEIVELTARWQEDERSFDTEGAPDPTPLLRVAPDV